MKTIPLKSLLTICLALYSALATGGTQVEVRLTTGKIANADYHLGKQNRPAVLVLHGFLQTSAFPTVSTMLSALEAAGYSTLAPTLSLGISRRNKSLACEAVHLHSLADDAAEIAYWTHWLTDHGHSRIILVGHSFGNIQLLSFLQRKPSAAVERALMVSLTDVEIKQSSVQRQNLVQDLRDRIARGDKALAEAEFGPCRKYVSPPKAFLSYAEMSRATILDGIAKSPVPVSVVLGGKDDRMGPDWAKQLQARHIPVRIISGANHFFDNQFEFDLQDAVLEAIGSDKADR